MCSSFERIMKKEKAEGRAEGKAEGEIKGTAKCVIELLKDIGNPPETLEKIVMGQTDIEVLRGWLKTASRAKSIEDFERAIGLVRC